MPIFKNANRVWGSNSKVASTPFSCGPRALVVIHKLAKYRPLANTWRATVEPIAAVRASRPSAAATGKREEKGIFICTTVGRLRFRGGCATSKYEMHRSQRIENSQDSEPNQVEIDWFLAMREILLMPMQTQPTQTLSVAG